jgi:hypothetical protein
MNYPELESVIKHLQKTCTCLSCKAKYKLEDINIIATTKTEGLFETSCKKCGCSTIVTVLLTPEMEVKDQKMQNQRKHGGITKNDILDIKNFLNKFDGDFKKIFTKNK